MRRKCFFVTFSSFDLTKVSIRRFKRSMSVSKEAKKMRGNVLNDDISINEHDSQKKESRRRRRKRRRRENLNSSMCEHCRMTSTVISWHIRAKKEERERYVCRLMLLLQSCTFQLTTTSGTSRWKCISCSNMWINKNPRFHIESGHSEQIFLFADFFFCIEKNELFESTIERRISTEQKIIVWWIGRSCRSTEENDG